ncbi:MAG: DNA methyltransferase, partial [Lentisphaerae bacterium]|nr:DNA methyltransferase [Lentisphaerota bacterium]
GYNSTKEDDRYNIFLTNTLEKLPPTQALLLNDWYSAEAEGAANIKENKPVMIVLGNPPYSGESANKTTWIASLMDDYKKEPGGVEKLKERNSKWINDDYVKFIRSGQYFIEKNAEGILAFINPHGYLDNTTFRGMRWNLLKTFDEIYIIDLHGNSKKKEVCPNGNKDENVFDIQQGVSINIFIKTGKGKDDDLGTVHHYDLYGKRENKYEFLMENRLNSINFTTVHNIAPNYFFIPKDFEKQNEYNKGFQVNELFKIKGTGIITKRDKLCISNTPEQCYDGAKDLVSLPKHDFYTKYQMPQDVRDWRYEWAMSDILDHKLSKKYIKMINYRPFDNKFIYYTGRSRGYVGWPVLKVMQHFLEGDNVGLVASRQCASNWRYIFLTKLIGDLNLTGVAGRYGSGCYFPLYLYNDDLYLKERQPNLNMNIVDKLIQILNLSFTDEKENDINTFSPIDILDYIYAVLYSPSYREKYNEFLKIDFPRVPYPESKEFFWKLVKCGSEIRELHLLDSSKVNNYITEYSVTGTNIVTRRITKKDWQIDEKDKSRGRVWINDQQYFDHVPLVAWEFFIGGYQPAQKWLKDRKDRELSCDDILHYQKIIVALTETDRLMKEIDKVVIL